MNKLESPSQKNALCKFGCNWPIVSRKRIKKFKFVIVYSLNVFRYYFSLEKGVALNMNKLEFPSPKELPSLVEISPTVLEKKIFKYHHCIFAISLLSSLGTGRGPSFE